MAVEHPSRPSPLDREAIAHLEVGQTSVSPGVVQALVWFFLLAIVTVPVFEVVSPGGAANGGVASWVRFGGIGNRVSEAFANAPIGTPSRWSRAITANRVMLAELAAFEAALEDGSRLGRTLRPPAQLLLTSWLGAGNERVYVGRGAWLFYRADTEHVTGPGFLAPAVRERRRAAASEWVSRPHPDPLPAIVDFARQLSDRGISLVLVPTPVKPSVHPGEFVEALADSREPVQNASYPAFVQAVRAAGIELFDPAPVLVANRRGGPQYLERDTHWRPEAMEGVADALGSVIGERLPARLSDSAMRLVETSVTNAGDTATMLDLPRRQLFYAPERVQIRRVVFADGSPWRPSRDADVLVMGDSFSNIYSLESMGWGTSAGFVEHLAHGLRRPVDRIVQNADGAFATRELLAQGGPDRLAGTRLVIWQFATRELSFGDWRPVDIPAAR